MEAIWSNRTRNHLTPTSNNYIQPVARFKFSYTHTTMRLLKIAIAIILVVTAVSNGHAGLLNTDNADPVEAGHLEIELNGSHSHDRDSSGGVTTRTRSTDGDLTATVGLADGLDASVSAPYTARTSREVDGQDTGRYDGFNDLAIAAKYRFLDASGLKLAVKPALLLPTGRSSEGLSDGRPGYSLAIIATREFAQGKIAINANLGYERHNYRDKASQDANRCTIYTGSIAAEAELADGLKLGLDAGLATNADRTSNTPLGYALAGATYELAKAIEVYAGGRFGLTRPEADLAALFGAKLKF